MFNHAIILAAGRGIRLMPLSKKIPKAMVKVKNETLILSGIKKIQKYIKNIHITVGYKGSVIAEHVIKNNVKIHFVFLEPYYNIESDIKFKVLLTKLKSVFSPNKRLILNFFIMKNTIENNRIYENIKILN